MRELRFQIPSRACFPNCWDQITNRTIFEFYTEPQNPNTQMLLIIRPHIKIIPK